MIILLVNLSWIPTAFLRKVTSYPIHREQKAELGSLQVDKACRPMLFQAEPHICHANMQTQCKQTDIPFPWRARSTVQHGGRRVPVGSDSEPCRADHQHAVFSYHPVLVCTTRDVPVSFVGFVAGSGRVRWNLSIYTAPPAQSRDR